MRLKELRLKNKLTQTELGKIVGTCQKTLANYETKITEAPYNILIKLADYFKVSTDYLLEHETENLLDISQCDNETKELLKTITKLNIFEIQRLKAFIEGIKEGQKQIRKENFNNWI